ncbi:MAG: NAD(+)/NADH kinase [Actinomycetota bacterium]
MKRAAIVLHNERVDAVECARSLSSMLGKLGVEVSARPSDASRIGEGVHSSALEETYDLMFALGGDGTFLRAAELAALTGTPLLGVNLGHVGFLTELERSEIEAAIDRICDGGVTVTERLALEATLDNAPALWALNDISISKLEPGRLIKISVSINAEQLTSIAADALVVATPTGSTAYSFSAGGPIVGPDVAAIVITPVSPHLTFDRSVIASAKDTIEVTIASDSDPVGVSADGKGWVHVPNSSTITIRKSDKPLRMANVDRVSFWRLVRTKFGLPSR